MKLLLSVLWKTLLLYLAALAGFVTGITVPALRLYRTLSQSATGIRTYDFDWLMAVFLVWFILVIAGLLRKRRTEVSTATIALVLVLVIVTFFTQLGIKNTPV